MLLGLLILLHCFSIQVFLSFSPDCVLGLTSFIFLFMISWVKKISFLLSSCQIVFNFSFLAPISFWLVCGVSSPEEKKLDVKDVVRPGRKLIFHLLPTRTFLPEENCEQMTFPCMWLSSMCSSLNDDINHIIAAFTRKIFLPFDFTRFSLFLHPEMCNTFLSTSVASRSLDMPTFPYAATMIPACCLMF